jgi:hypothetical protein
VIVNFARTSPERQPETALNQDKVKLLKSKAFHCSSIFFVAAKNFNSIADVTFCKLLLFCPRI